MAHNVFVNEHIVILADSFTRKRAMHINIAKVIFSIENTTLSLCFLITLTLASPEMISIDTQNRNCRMQNRMSGGVR